MTEKVGFAGTGLMGRGMAKNILAAGYPVAVVAHRSRAPVEDLVRLDATELHSYRELAAGSDIVVLCVTGTPEVESVVHGRDGLLEGAHAGLMVVDCSTSEPASSERIAAALDERGASFVDAPLARTPAEAEAGRLNTMVGAADDDFERVRPCWRPAAKTSSTWGRWAPATRPSSSTTSSPWDTPRSYPRRSAPARPPESI